MMTSCVGDYSKEKSLDNLENSLDAYDKFVELQKIKIVEAEKVTKDLCDNFPKELIFKYNPKGKRIEIEPVNFNDGTLDFCNIRLMDEDSNIVSGGIVRALAPAGPKPLSGIKPIDGLVQKIEGLGDKAFYINESYKLTILKNGLIYNFVAPIIDRRRYPNKNLEVLVEMAKHYGLDK